MRYSTVPAINLEEMAAHNRELISKLPDPVPSYFTWNPGTQTFELDQRCLDLFEQMFSPDLNPGLTD